MKQLGRRQPLINSLTKLQENFNHLFEPAWMEEEGRMLNILSSDWVPSIDLCDEKGRYVIHADVPGVEPKDIDISMDDNILTIKGHRESIAKEKDNGYVREERLTGSFYRSIALPEIVDANKIKAKSSKGVLVITIPKKKNGSKQKIKVRLEG